MARKHKNEWKQPMLTVLTRRAPDETVLAVCKLYMDISWGFYKNCVHIQNGLCYHSKEPATS